MVSFNPPKPQYVDVLETVWRPHRNAKSLLGEGYSGSSLSSVGRAPDTGNRGAVNRSRVYHHPQTRAQAKADVER